MRPGRENPGVARRTRSSTSTLACFNEARARRPGNGTARSWESPPSSSFNEARARRSGNGL